MLFLSILLCVAVEGRKTKRDRTEKNGPVQRRASSMAGIIIYKIWHELFSRNGLTFWLEKPTNRQSSCSCSVTYLTISAHACDTGIRWMLASRRNCSTILRCCCKLLAIRSMTAVSDSPMLAIFSNQIVHAKPKKCLLCFGGIGRWDC